MSQISDAFLRFNTRLRPVTCGARLPQSLENSDDAVMTSGGGRGCRGGQADVFQEMIFWSSPQVCLFSEIEENCLFPFEGNDHDRDIVFVFVFVFRWPGQFILLVLFFNAII